MCKLCEGKPINRPAVTVDREIDYTENTGRPFVSNILIAGPRVEQCLALIEADLARQDEVVIEPPDDLGGANLDLEGGTDQIWIIWSRLDTALPLGEPVDLDDFQENGTYSAAYHLDPATAQRADGPDPSRLEQQKRARRANKKARKLTAAKRRKR